MEFVVAVVDVDTIGVFFDDLYLYILLLLGSLLSPCSSPFIVFSVFLLLLGC